MALEPNHRLNAGELQALLEAIEWLKANKADRPLSLTTAQAKLALQLRLLR